MNIFLKTVGIILFSVIAGAIAWAIIDGFFETVGRALARGWKEGMKE